MVACLFRRQESGVDLLLHVRVVLGYLAERSVAQQVNAGVPDMSDDVAAGAKHETGRRCAHALLVGLDDRALENGTIGRTQRVSHRRERLFPCKIANLDHFTRDDLHGHFAGNFASGMTAHPICDDEKPTLWIGVGV